MFSPIFSNRMEATQDQGPAGRPRRLDGCHTTKWMQNGTKERPLSQTPGKVQHTCGGVSVAPAPWVQVSLPLGPPGPGGTRGVGVGLTGLLLPEPSPRAAGRKEFNSCLWPLTGCRQVPTTDPPTTRQSPW